MHASAAVVLACGRRLILGATVVALPLLTGAGFVHAQNAIDLNTENVTVDLSVIGDSGGRATAGAASTSPLVSRPGGGLLLPAPTNPTSQLHVAVPRGPDGGIKLRPPSSTPKPVAKKSAPPAKKPEPRKPAKPAVAATEPPAPLTASPPTEPAVAAPAAKAAPPTPPAMTAPTKKDAPETKVAAAPAQAPAPAAAKPAPVKTEQASTPPAADATKETRAVQVIFQADVSKLPNEAKDGLSLLSKKLKDNEALRVQLLAYAGGKDLTASKARRLSLSRALSVRSYLIENGIRSTRIDVRALGDKTTEEPANRVDVTIVER
jgi:outer membrane protein OmpA-like peptidoglycan-associated protein